MRADALPPWFSIHILYILINPRFHAQISEAQAERCLKHHSFKDQMSKVCIGALPELDEWGDTRRIHSVLMNEGVCDLIE